MVIQQGVLGYTFYVIDVYKSHAHEKKVSFLLLNRFFILSLQKNLHISANIYSKTRAAVLQEALIYLQLPYFTKEAEDCENNFDRWIYVLKHMEALNRLPWEAQSPIFKRLGEIAEISQLSTEDRIKYDAAIQWYRDNAFLLEGAEEVGLQKGMKKGLEQGRAEGEVIGLEKGRAEGEQTKALNIARNLKSMGLGVADIQKATGLSEEEIREL